jgi:hypothetical protein
MTRKNLNWWHFRRPQNIPTYCSSVVIATKILHAHFLSEEFALCTLCETQWIPKG